MTKPKTRPKTPQQLADEHWDWLETIIFIQMKLAMRLFKDGFVHGHKHGKEENIGTKKNHNRTLGNTKG